MKHFFSRLFCDFTRKLDPCKELALSFILFLLPSLIAPLQPAGTEFNDPRFMGLTLIHGFGQAALLLYLIKNIKSRRPADYCVLPLKIRHIALGLLAWFLAFPLLFLFGLALRFLPEEWLASSLPAFRWSYTNYNFLPLLLLSCLATGYWEELYFRAYLPVELTRLGMSFTPAALVSVALFGAGHFYQGSAGFAISCFLGLYLTVIFRVAKNLHVPAIGHGLYNFSILVASGYLEKLEKFL